ncbi:unnamed protein product [Hymenolepis diminuta]|uniref:Uncharacterized protein n=1 Tax=Hymenolepis diminuta TaxID=6216 RepID=A0A564Y521_HYMDI|nr:unnamed protein product [Hymenolepis diminuta]
MLCDSTDRCYAGLNSKRTRSSIRAALQIEISIFLELDWINELYLIQFPGENNTYQTLTLNNDAQNLVGGCNQCLHVVEIPHPSMPTQSTMPNSTRTQLQLSTSGIPYGDRFTFERGQC